MKTMFRRLNTKRILTVRRTKAVKVLHVLLLARRHSHNMNVNFTKSVRNRKWRAMEIVRTLAHARFHSRAPSLCLPLVLTRSCLLYPPCPTIFHCLRSPSLSQRALLLRKANRHLLPLSLAHRKAPICQYRDQGVRLAPCDPERAKERRRLRHSNLRISSTYRHFSLFSLN